MVTPTLRPFRTRAEVPVPDATVHFPNIAKRFWGVYGMPTGSARRRALLALFQQPPGLVLPVNNKWQANTHDSDLALLLKRGLLRQVRDGGKRRHAQNKSSLKRQTYLVAT